MKISAYLFSFLFTGICFSQFATPELYAEYNLSIDTAFDSSIYHKITLGSQLTSYKWIAPEVEVSYYFGINSEERSAAEQSGPATYIANFNAFFEGFMWGLAPKLFYEDAGTRLVFIPKYHFGKVRAEGNFIDSEELSIEKEVKSNLNYWSFTLGIEESKWSNAATYGFYLYYSGFNAGEALNQLNFSEQGFFKDNYNTKTVGLGIRISYNFKRNPQLI